MLILVTGPDGFVGSSVCQELVKRKYTVRAAQWKAGPVSKGCESVVVGDVNGKTDWQKALEGVGSVVHLAARVHVMKDTSDDPLSDFRKVNVEGTMRLAECAVAEGVKHFLFISSIKVNGEATNGRPFTEDDAPAPEDPYGISKWEAEQSLRKIGAKTGMAVTIIRPPILYGQGVKANFLKLMKLVAMGIPLPVGAINNKRSFLGLGNLTDLICHCIGESAAAGETFVVSDGYDLSTADLVRKLGTALGTKGHVISLHPSVLKVFGIVSGKSNIIKRLTESLEVDSSKVRNLLNWQPPFSVDEELKRTAEWFLLRD